MRADAGGRDVGEQVAVLKKHGVKRGIVVYRVAPRWRIPQRLRSIGHVELHSPVRLPESSGDPPRFVRSAPRAPSLHLQGLKRTGVLPPVQQGWVPRRMVVDGLIRRA